MQVIKSITECPERHIEFAEYVKEKWPNIKKMVLPKLTKVYQLKLGCHIHSYIYEHDTIK